MRLSTRSMSSIDSLVTSSAGPSVQHFAPPYDQSPWSDLLCLSDDLTGSVYAAANSGTTMSFMARGHASDFERRRFGWLLLSLMPEDGLDEALTSLAEILAFRLAPRQPALPPAVYERPARVATSEVRPNLVIAE